MASPRGKTLGTLLIIFFALVAFAAWIAWSNSIPPKDVLKVVIESTVHAFFVVVILGVVLEYVIKKEHQEEILHAVREELFSDKGLAELASKERLVKLMRSQLEVLTDSVRAEALYSGGIRPYIEGSAFNLRTEYQYQIKFTESDEYTRTLQGIGLSHGNYYEVSQAIRYRTHFDRRHADIDRRHVRVAFIFGHQLHARASRTQRYIFREVLHLEELDVERIMRSAHSTHVQLVSQLFNPILKDPSGNVIPLEEVSIKDSVVELAYDARSLWSEGKDGFLSINFEYSMPFSRSAKHFLVVFPEPTDRPKVTFVPALSQKVEAIPFFTRDERTLDPTSERTREKGALNFELTTWLLPSSGIVFVWR